MKATAPADNACCETPVRICADHDHAGGGRHAPQLARILDPILIFQYGVDECQLRADLLTHVDRFRCIPGFIQNGCGTDLPDQSGELLAIAGIVIHDQNTYIGILFNLG